MQRLRRPKPLRNSVLYARRSGGCGYHPGQYFLRIPARATVRKIVASRTQPGLGLRCPNVFLPPVTGTYGNVGRDVLFGPGLADLDLSLLKTTHLDGKDQSAIPCSVLQPS